MELLRSGSQLTMKSLSLFSVTVSECRDSIEYSRMNAMLCIIYWVMSYYTTTVICCVCVGRVTRRDQASLGQWHVTESVA